MKHLPLLLIALVLAGCGPKPVVPLIPPTATAYIDASYPTAQAAVSVANQSANGIDVRLDRAWMEGKNLNANICYSLPDASDWTVWSANLKYADVMVDQYGATLVNIQEPAGGQAGVRCDTLTFVVPPDADLTAATISIDAIGATPREGDYCSIYLPKIQQKLQERGIGITLDCQAGADGALAMQITGKPADMTDQQAQDIVYSDEFFTLKGPWTFSLSLNQ